MSTPSFFNGVNFYASGIGGVPADAAAANTTDLLAHLRAGLIRDDLKNPGISHYPYPESSTPFTHSAGRPDAPPTTKEDKKSMFK